MKALKTVERSALVILSGGQDSTTCLYWAKQKFKDVHAITFDYGQRHRREIKAAKIIAEMAGVVSHEVLTLGADILKGTSPLVDPSQPVEHYASADKLPGGLEKTFVPARNMLFLTLAANRAYCLGITDLVTGVCEEDFGGYPDCRRGFIDDMEDCLDTGIWDSMNNDRPSPIIWTPLMKLSKADSVKLAVELPGCFDALAHSHTCYDGQYPPNPFNHASLLRARGFHIAVVPDPLILRAKDEKLLPPDYPVHGLVEGTRFDSPEAFAALTGGDFKKA